MVRKSFGHLLLSASGVAGSVGAPFAYADNTLVDSYGRTRPAHATTIGKLRQVDCSTAAALTAALSGSLPGDEIVISGNFSGNFDITISGTLANPITIRSNTNSVITSLGTDAVFHMRSDYVDIIGLIIDGFSDTNSNIGIGLRYGDVGGDAEAVPAHFLRILDCEIRNSGQELIKIGQNSSSIEIGWCNFHDSGKRTNRQYGEAIYIGSNVGVDDTHTVNVHHNEFYNITAESVEVKTSTTYGVTVKHNAIHDCVFGNDAPANGYTNATINFQERTNTSATPSILASLGHEVAYNRIWNISEASDSGDGTQIYPGAMRFACPVNAHHNLAWDYGHHGADVKDAWVNAAAVDRTYNIKNMTLYSPLGGGTDLRITDLQPNTVMNQDRNLIESYTGLQVNTFTVATAGIFAGPLTGTAAVGGIPGMGFQPTAASGVTHGALAVKQ